MYGIRSTFVRYVYYTNDCLQLPIGPHLSRDLFIVRTLLQRYFFSFPRSFFLFPSLPRSFDTHPIYGLRLHVISFVAGKKDNPDKAPLVDGDDDDEPPWMPRFIFDDAYTIHCVYREEIRCHRSLVLQPILRSIRFDTNDTINYTMDCVFNSRFYFFIRSMFSRRLSLIVCERLQNINRTAHYVRYWIYECVCVCALSICIYSAKRDTYVIFAVP